MSAAAARRRFATARALLGATLIVCTASTCGDGAARRQDPQPPPIPELQRPVDVPAELGERAMTHVRALVAIGERYPGSPGWQRSVDYIAGQIEALGLPARRDRFTSAKEKLSFENLVVRIPGGTTDFVVLGAHHDTKHTSGHPDPDNNYHFVGANDGGSGVGLLLALAEQWVKQPPPVSVELVFFDGEESIPYQWDLERALFGSRRYVERYEAQRAHDPESSRIGAMILLDMVGATDLQIDDDSNSTPTLKGIFRGAARACGHERVFFATTAYAVTDDHLPFRDAGIPVIDLIDLANNPQWHTANDTIEHMSAASLQVVGEVVWTALPAVGTRYAGATSGR